MKKAVMTIVLIFILLVISNPTKAQEDRWAYITSDVESDIYMDRNTIIKVGTNLTAWKREIYFETQMSLPSSSKKFNYDETKIQQIFDCENRRMKNISIVFYLKDVPVESIEFSNAKWSYVVPDTVGELTLIFVCNQK